MDNKKYTMAELLAEFGDGFDENKNYQKYDNEIEEDIKTEEVITEETKTEEPKAKGITKVMPFVFGSSGTRRGAVVNDD